MLKSLKLLGRPLFRGVAYATEATAASGSGDAWANLVADLQKDPLPLRATSMSKSQVQQEIDEALNKSVSTLPASIFFSFLQAASMEQDAELRGKTMQLMQKTAEVEDRPEFSVGSIAYLCKIGETNHDLIEKNFKLLEGSGKSNLLGHDIVLDCIAQTKAANVALPNNIMDLFVAILTSQTSLFSIGSILRAFSILSLSGETPLRQPLFDRAKELIGNMNCSEAIALFKYLAAQGFREMSLISPLIQVIYTSKDPISMNQIVSLAHAAAHLTVYDARLLRKLSDDLSIEIIHLNSWFDAVSLIASFSRILFEHKNVWDILLKWVNSHMDGFKKLPLSKMTIVTKAFATMGVEDAQPLASVLRQALEKPDALRHAPSQDVWLQAIYTLAMFQDLPPHLGETVLNKEFIDVLMKSSKNKHYTVASAQRLLNVQTNLVQSHGDRYTGPRISKETFGATLASNEAKDSILMAKFGNNSRACIDALLTSGLYLIAPKTHIEAGRIDDLGYYWDAAVSTDKTQRFTPTDTWTSNTSVRPILLFDWKQRKKTLDLGLGRSTEECLLGEERMMLRHLRAAGLDPIVLFMSDLTAFSSQDERMKYIKTLFGTK